MPKKKESKKTAPSITPSIYTYISDERLTPTTTPVWCFLHNERVYRLSRACTEIMKPHIHARDPLGKAVRIHVAGYTSTGTQGRSNGEEEGEGEKVV